MKISKFSVPALAGLILTAPAWAADPSFDCSSPASSAEEAICASDALAAMDVELARLFALAVNGPNMTSDREKELKAYQRGWIKGRDDCWKASVGLEACVAGSYAMRIHELREGYADARAEEGGSTGPFAYVCDGLDAGLSAVFVNAGEPMLSLKWRENWLVLPQVPSGSGARYAAEGQGEFWTKGDEAMLTLPDGEPLSCRQDDIG